MLYFCIVIYNKECEDSSSIKKLLSITNNIIIVDNSDIENNNDNYCNKNKITYISMNGNKGLSKAYNKVLDYLKEKKGYLMLLDDDTSIDLDYIKYVMNNFDKYDIFIPVIRCNKQLISPLKKIGIKYIAINKKTKKIYAINTCLAVNLNVYRNFRYDEKLFLDNVDLSFFKFINKCKYKYRINVIDSNIIQKFFLIENKDINKFKNRYKILIKDNVNYYTSFVDKILLFIKVIYMGIKYSIKYKNIFLSLFIYSEYIKCLLKK